MIVMVSKVLISCKTISSSFFSKISFFVNVYAKKTIYFFLFIGITFSIPLILKKITLGFKVGKIFYIPNLSIFDKSDKKIPSEILQIMSENFLFLDKGAQCYVFESLDQKYVLKLFRRNPKVFKPKSSNASINTFISSCEIAWENIPNLTGILYVHLHKTEDVFGRIYLTNPLGELFGINLDDCIFVLQRKAKTFKKAIMEDFYALDDVSLKRKIKSYFTHINDRLEKSIENIDPDLSTNFGFLNDDLLEIDIGNFQHKELDLQRAKEQYFQRLKIWMNKNCPEKLTLLDDKN